MRFDETYQGELLHRMTDASFLRRVGKLLEPSMFDPQLEPIAEEALKTFRRTGRALSFGQLKQIAMRSEVNLNGCSPGHGDFDFEEIEKFARYRRMRDGILEAQSLMEQGKFDQAEKAVILSNVRPVLDPNEDEGWSNVTRSELKPLKREGVVGTGLKLLDGYLDGGVGAGEMGVVLAPSSGGKTTFLIWLACAALKQKKSVAFVTLEDPKRHIHSSLARCLLNTSKPSKEQWKKIGKKIGNCHLCFQAPSSLSAARLGEDIPPKVDLIIIDYADYLVGPASDMGFSYENLGRIYLSVRDLGQKRKVPVWTASQINRGGYDADVAEGEHIEASLRKFMVARQVISINQTGAERIVDDEGRSYARLYIAKNTFGPRHKTVPVMIQWNTCQFTEQEK